MNHGTSVSIHLRGLRQRFGGHTVLDGIDLDVPAGTTLALLGPSGCGKSTLLKLLAGLLQPDEGCVMFGGDTVADAATCAPPEARDLGMVFQDYALWPHLTVAGNVAFPLEMRGVPRAERTEPPAQAGCRRIARIAAARSAAGSRVVRTVRQLAAQHDQQGRRDDQHRAGDAADDPHQRRAALRLLRLAREIGRIGLHGRHADLVVGQAFDAVHHEGLDLRHQRADVGIRAVLDEHGRRRRFHRLRERIVVRQHDLHARHQHAVDLRQRGRQLLRHAVDEAHALLGRRGDEAVLLEQIAEIVVAALGQAARAQRFHRADHLVLVDVERPGLAAVGRVLRGVDAVLEQRHDHLVDVLLGQVSVQFLLATGEQRAERERARDGRTPPS